MSENAAKRHGLLLVCVVVLGLLWISAEVRNWRSRRQLAALWVAQVSISVVDDATGEKLSTHFSGLTGTGPGKYLPLCRVAAHDLGFDVIMVSDKPEYLTVGSEGYRDQPFTVDANSPSTVTIRLKKK